MDRYFNINESNQISNHLQSFGKKVKNHHAKPMKILYVTFFEYPHTGGLSNYITSLKNGCQRLGHQADVLAPNQMSQAFKEQLVPAAAEIRKFMNDRYGLVNEKIIKNLSYLYVFELFLKEKHLEDYDLIHAQDLFALFVLARLNQTYQKPLLFTPHGFFTKSRLTFNKIQKNSLEEAYFTEIEKRGIEACDELILIADSFRPSLMELGARQEKMTTVHTGIDYQPFPKQINQDKIILSCISRLSPRKGHDILFQALARIPEVLANVEVWIVGDGVMKETLIQQARDLKLDNVVFFGKRDDIANILSHSDIYVLATVNDNFPLSVMEAMFSHQAVITTTCGGIPEMIQHEQTGILCEPGNIEQLAQSIKRLVLHKDDRETLAKAAAAYAHKHLSSQVMAAKVEEVYKQYRKETLNE
ncbi:glycosyltransferase family 4 protein [Bacillus ectoiniformans]|uniref:glycosyltransferase family 4 protein n=1 Tax=Bacillus ectoiniformans TaxID=1494429 RepID=UPI00195CF846|nr:glycosyltransferase family 4 protein [Bacillus ectoiniformans]